MEITREKVRRRFCGAFGGDELKARQLEILLFNVTLCTAEKQGIPLVWEEPKVRFKYTTKALSWEYNLRHPRNPTLGNQVRDGSISLKTFVNMTPYEMFPELWEKHFEQAARRQLQKTIMSSSDGHDGAFTCGKCKSKKTQYVELQTRSADEPATVYVFCSNCSNRWKC